MLEKVLTIQNRLGIHARPAQLLVETTSQFDSDVFLEKDGLEINAKSIMGVLMLAAIQGSQINLRINGADEEDAFLALKQLFDNKFFED